MGKELFDNIPSKVGDLLNDVKNGRIGLPDLQRPFVWKDNKVRDLLDSMLKGYPIGYVMLWESPADFENKGQIGINDKTFNTARDLVIDGQQRLTALLANFVCHDCLECNFVPSISVISLTMAWFQPMSFVILRKVVVPWRILFIMS